MKTKTSITVFLSFIVCILVVDGCQKSSIIDANKKDTSDAVKTRLRFTGRDSLLSQFGGIAFNADVSGNLQATENEGCPSPGIFLSGSGRGQATHLGNTVVEQTACVDENGNISGTFTYEGSTGGSISGTYTGTLKNDTLIADATIEKASVAAPRESPPADQNWGTGTIKGILTDSHFDYLLVGWLFHHSADNLKNMNKREVLHD